ncbi:FCD domain-containing protein [Herbaspirillum seropedicae]|uniref:FCD domain-containing protein n=1 Tax=Herbaspirillum seropedicae TaxID=964 RepID=UPI0008481989|nr:FCD domain-containing protein [Herbaspirillum seropedicae]
MVRLEKNRGVFVRKFEKYEAIEMFEFRAVLEEASARRLVALITDEQLAELEKLSKELEQLAPNNVLNEYYNLNILFHDNMVTLAGNSSMLETYRRLTDQMHLLRRQGYNKGNGLLQPCAEHRAILNALLRRDPDAVARASHDHVMNGMVRLLAL